MLKLIEKSSKKEFNSKDFVIMNAFHNDFIVKSLNDQIVNVSLTEVFLSFLKEEMIKNLKMLRFDSIDREYNIALTIANSLDNNDIEFTHETHQKAQHHYYNFNNSTASNELRSQLIYLLLRKDFTSLEYVQDINDLLIDIIALENNVYFENTKAENKAYDDKFIDFAINYITKYYID